MGRKVYFDKVLRVDKVPPATGKKRDRSQDWKPPRNPLLEQTTPIPLHVPEEPDDIGERGNLRPPPGAFVVLARPNEPEPVVGDRRRGLRVGQHKDTTMALDKGVELKGCRSRTRGDPPEGTLMDSDIARGLRLHPLTEDEKMTMWNKYQNALEKSIQRDGDTDGVTWRHRKTKEPVPFPKQHPHRRLFKSTVTVPYGRDNNGPDDAAPVLKPPPRCGRRTHSGARKDHVERLLVWAEARVDAEEGASPRPIKMPASFTEGAHMDAMMDDSRSAKLAPPVDKQRRHIPGKQGKIDEVISPVGDCDRRALNARDMHEMTARGPLPTLVRRRRKSH